MGKDDHPGHIFLLYCISVLLTSLYFSVAFRYQWQESIFSCTQHVKVLSLGCGSPASLFYLKGQEGKLRQRKKSEIPSGSGPVLGPAFCSKLTLLLASKIQNPWSKYCCSFSPRKNSFSNCRIIVLCPESNECIKHKNSNIQN